MTIPAIISDLHLHGTPETRNGPGIRFYSSSDSNLCSRLYCFKCAYGVTGFGTCLIRNSNRVWDLYFLSSRTIHRNYASSLRLLVSSSAMYEPKHIRWTTAYSGHAMTCLSCKYSKVSECQCSVEGSAVFEQNLYAEFQMKRAIFKECSQNA